MEPQIERGDLVFVMEGTRFPGAGSQEGTGIVTAERAAETGYQRFGSEGDVILYRPEGDRVEVPIIHRAMLWVEEGENWFDRANPKFLRGGNCTEVAQCPAPSDGFITKGDDNPAYDQALRLRSCDGVCDPVKPKWVIGTAEAKTPYLGDLWLQPA